MKSYPKTVFKKTFIAFLVWVGSTYSKYQEEGKETKKLLSTCNIHQFINKIIQKKQYSCTFQTI